MNKRNNAKIAKWLGHEVDGIHAKHPEFGWYEIPDYDRAEYAITLLPVLVAKGYSYQLIYISGENVFMIYAPGTESNPIAIQRSETIASAIRGALMKLIEHIL